MRGKGPKGHFHFDGIPGKKGGCWLTLPLTISSFFVPQLKNKYITYAHLSKSTYFQLKTRHLIATKFLTSDRFIDPLAAGGKSNADPAV